MLFGSKTRFTIFSYCVGLLLVLFIYWRSFSYYTINLGGFIAGPLGFFFPSPSHDKSAGVFGIITVVIFLLLGSCMSGRCSYPLLLVAVFLWFFFGYMCAFQYL